jgi:cytochrome c biogenesis protein CcmG/thiol:disulfide interchange protein DsbE
MSPVKTTLRTLLLWSAPLALAAMLASCAREEKVETAPSEPRKAAPDFALKDINGSTVKLSDYKGKVVLLNFWATWCAPCKVEIPWFIGFETQYKDRNFAVLGVSLDDDGWDSLKPYLNQHKMNYKVLLGNDDVSKSYGDVDSLPTTFIIDRRGNIASTHMGLVSKNIYEDEIKKLLRDPKVGMLTQPPLGQLAFVLPR